MLESLAYIVFQSSFTKNDYPPLINLGIVFALQDNLNRAQELWQEALLLYTDNDDWDKATIALFNIALGNSQQGLADLQSLIDKGALPAALQNALGDAEMLMKCPTPLEGIEEAFTLLKSSLEQT